MRQLRSDTGPGPDASAGGYADYRQVVADSFRQWYERERDSWTANGTNVRVTHFALAAAPPERDGVRRRVLDIGCGRGLQTAALAEGLTAGVTGLDLLDVWSAPPVTRGAADFRRGDFLGFAGEPLDLLVDNGCLHHQRREDWPRWVAHGRALLRPGGVWVVSFFLSPGDGVVAHPLDDGRLNWWLTEPCVRDLFADAGFTATGRLEIDRDFEYRGHGLKYLVLSFTRD